jgi:hypothetical protein
MAPWYDNHQTFATVISKKALFNVLPYILPINLADWENIAIIGQGFIAKVMQCNY